ncbi:cytochrome-c oxidase, cbb3-type subunit I [bacterium]|nr:cytochrome-c oxidase, cbb3-type subunit I [bacterium]MBU1984397.1 cytochrome-c oxidase, cbb3-type subunit I [bacterium]
MSSNPAASLETFAYDDAVVRRFVQATFFWGVVGMLVGVVVAAQLAFWQLNGGIPWITFGRLRPLHTNAVIFAFTLNAIFAAIYYSSQRLLKTRMFSDVLSRIHFWGWQIIIVLAAVTLLSGHNTSKEYAELEWPLDVLITGVWVIFGVNFFMTIVRRRERHLYVALWFYIATIVTIALLHVVNSLALPVSLLKSYSVFAGVQDAMTQWWYGHNAVGFVLTTPILGMMYYYLPKAAQRPVFSYRLSVIHFWALIFVYIWAGPHHLHYTALPDWAQTLGMVFSLILLAPSWGGMLNGLLTLRGAWHKLREDPILKFLAVSVTFYGMSTFEGPMMSIKSVNSLTHYTDYTIAHVHVGALGWVGFMIFGIMYYMVPRLWRRELFSRNLANLHFWIATIGILLYIIPIWIAGIMQGLMWRAFDADGLLFYPNFIETTQRILPFYHTRLLGGILYLGGLLLMVYNLIKTCAGAKVPADETAQAPSLAVLKPEAPEPRTRWHHLLTGQPLAFSILALMAVGVGGVVEIGPLLMPKSYVPIYASAAQPYTPLELEGRDLYLREGCNNCHSQMIRPLRDEVLRYGDYSKPGEFEYDHPFLWGSRRIGPDLARVGPKYPPQWHYLHFQNPRSTSPGSIMPPYPWLLANKLESPDVEKKMSVMRKLGVPYSDDDIIHARTDLETQAADIAAKLEAEGYEGTQDKEVIALIAYLERMGKIPRPNLLAGEK